VQRAISARPACDVIPEHYLDGEIKQDRHRKILFPEALFNHFQGRSSLVRGKADFGEEMDNEKGLDT